MGAGAVHQVGGTDGLDDALRHVSRVREQARAAHQRLRAAQAARGDTWGTYVQEPGDDPLLLEDYLRMARTENPTQALVVTVAVLKAADHQGRPRGGEGGQRNGSRQQPA